MTAGPTAPARAEPEPVWWIGIRLLEVFVRLTVRLRITGLERIPASGPALVVANHVSYLDPVVLVVLAHRRGRRMRFLGVREVFDRPVIGWVLRAGRHIPVGDGAERMVAIRQAGAALARGDLVLVYPEGTIPAAGPAAAAKGGAGLLALRMHVPVIPVATAGLERGAGRWWRRRVATVVVGAPVDLSNVAGTGRARYEAASDRLLAAIRAL